MHNGVVGTEADDGHLLGLDTPEIRVFVVIDIECHERFPDPLMGPDDGAAERPGSDDWCLLN